MSKSPEQNEDEKTEDNPPNNSIESSVTQRVPNSQTIPKLHNSPDVPKLLKTPPEKLKSPPEPIKFKNIPELSTLQTPIEKQKLRNPIALSKVKSPSDLPKFKNIPELPNLNIPKRPPNVFSIDQRLSTDSDDGSEEISRLLDNSTSSSRRIAIVRSSAAPRHIVSGRNESKSSSSEMVCSGSGDCEDGGDESYMDSGGGDDGGGGQEDNTVHGKIEPRALKQSKSVDQSVTRDYRSRKDYFVAIKTSRGKEPGTRHRCCASMRSLRSNTTLDGTDSDQDHRQEQQQQRQQNHLPTSDWTPFLFTDANGRAVVRPFPDSFSIRSLASIGLGSSDGRKLTIRRVPTSPSELINMVHPPL